MPGHIYMGPLGPEEKEKYGADNWYDWSIEHWGTKWNAESADFDGNYICFESAWSPAQPVIAKLASLFPEAELWYQYEETGMCFCGAAFYRNGICVYEMSADLCRNYTLVDSDCFDEEERNECLIGDDEFPLQPDGIYVDAKDDGSIHIREYREGLLYECIDGEYMDLRLDTGIKSYWNENTHYRLLTKSET